MGDKSKGIYQKFTVNRTDGKDAPGAKHDGCNYFVLDLTHDPHAAAALRAYADSCREEYPLLADDLEAHMAQENELRQISSWVCIVPGRPGQPDWIASFTYKGTRQQSQEELAVHFRKEGETLQQGWKRAYRKGYRCVRARITVDI